MGKKRENGSGNVVRLPSGNWRCTIMDGYTDEGKRHLISFTAPTKGEVLQKVRNYWAEKECLAEEEGKEEKLNENSFSKWADMWYENHKTQVQPSTYSGYKYTLQLLKERFKETPIDAIKASDIKIFLNELNEEGCSPSKIGKCKTMLIQIFDVAESDEVVKRNPARLAKAIRYSDAGESSKDAFTEKEVRLMNSELPDNLLGHSIRTLLGSGIRVQELLALFNENIADDGSQIKVNRAVKMVDGKPVLGPPKSKRGERIVPIPKAYRPSVLYLKQHGGKALIWCSGKGNLLYGVGTFRRWFYREIKKIPGVRALTPHCCRHTYISLLQAKGVPMVEIARLVGHSNISTTDGYLHVGTKTLAEAVAVLDDLGEAKSE